MAINKNKVMEAAQKYVEKGQIDKAIKEYLKVVQEDPKDVRVWLKIGDLYAKKGSKQEATETYLKVAQFYSEQGFYLKAVAVYKQILKIDPRLVDVNLKLAEVYRQLGLLSDAMQQYELVAAFYHREGKTREALATIKDLVELDPENVATRIKLAELYSKEGMAKEAVAEFAKAADFLRAHNRMDDFIKVAERLVWHQPDNHAMNRELAQLYLKRSDPRRALQKLQACFKADPRDVETLALLAQAFQALDQKPKTVSVWKELARIHQENGEQAKAQDVYRKILALAPDDADALAALGGAARRAPAGTGGYPAMPPAPPAPPAAVAGGEAAPRSPSGNFPRVATPIGGAPVLRPSLIAEPIPAPHQGGEPRRPTGSFPLVQEPFPPDDAARFDLEEEVSATHTAERDTGTTRRRGASDMDVEVEVEDVGPASEEVLLGAGADPGEAHAEEIAKILTETDVYTKYSLHQKAIEHLKKVFELDPRNLEAREKLKDIFVALGRNAEAATELAKLVELTAPQNAEQASGYLRELFAIDSNDARGRALAARFHLDVQAPGLDVEVQVDSGLAVATSDIGAGLSGDMVEADLEEIGVEAAATPPPTIEAELSVDDADLGAADESIDFDLDVVRPSASSPAREYTQEVDPDQVAAELSLDADAFESAQELGFDDALPAAGDGATAFESDVDPDATPSPADFPSEPSATSTASPAARGRRSGAVPAVSADEKTYDVGVDDYAALGGPAPEGLDEFALDPGDAAFAESMSSEPEAAASPAPADGETSGGSSLEDDLDEADFFVSQDLFAEARDVLTNLLLRYPNHPLILAKLQDVEAMEHAAQGSPPATPLPAPPSAATPPPPAGQPRKPTVIAKPLGEEDADTHYDLGLAYKEMGLYDEAVKEFTLVKDTPGRAVQCHLMIGLCHLERGKLSEAVSEFKNGLYVEGITERESLALYFELGAAYEALGDVREALYYFEKVAKRDARFRDVEKRIEAVKAARPAGGAKAGASRDEADDFPR